MTLEEAKKILKKEGFVLNKIGKRLLPDKAFIEYEDPDVCEAMQIIESAGFGIGMELNRFDERKARLKEEREKHSNAPMPAPGEVKAEDGDLKAATDAFVVQENEIMRLKKENAELLEAIDKMKEGNPALKESASQFNEALLGEQSKEIERLKEKNLRLGKEIARLNKTIYKKNLKIEELRKESSRHLRGKIKMFGENVDLEQMLKDKNAVLSDVAEELRLAKIREKNLVEVSQKYMEENEELKKQLADNVVDKINANALKSAESALAYKEKVIAEKDEVIADLGKELKAQKDLVDDISLKYDGAKHNLKLRMYECEKLKNELEEKTKLVEIVRNASKEYCDYGVAANEFIKKLANLYVIASNKGTISNEMFERCKNYQTYGFPATCNKETKKEIDDIARGKENNKPRISTPEISEEELMKIQEKVVASCDIAEEGGDHSGAVVLYGKDFVKKVKENYDFFHDLFEKKNKEIAEFMFIESGHLGGNGILDQMENSNHPTEDNPEEVDMDEVLERVRKALEEGHTVSIDYKD